MRGHALALALRRAGTCSVLGVALLAAVGCRGEESVVPARWRGVPGGAVMAFRAPSGHPPAQLDALRAELVRRFSVESGSAGDLGWIVDPRAPTGYASLADSPTFRAAILARPETGAAVDVAWIYVDLQVQVDGLRARLLEASKSLAPILDALGLSDLLFAVGEVREAGSAFDVDLLVQSVDADRGPSGLFAAGDASSSLLRDPVVGDRARIELRFDPKVAVRMLTAAIPQLREGEIRLDAALFGYVANAGVALLQQADGRLSLCIDADRKVTFAFGVRDHEEARDALARRIPQFDRERLQLPTGEEVRFEPGRIVIGSGVVAPAGSFRPSAPCSVCGEAVGRAGELTISHDGPARLRVKLHVD